MSFTSHANIFKKKRIQTGGGSSVQRFIRQSLRRSIGPSVADLNSKSPLRFSSSNFICAKDETDSDRRRFIGSTVHPSVAPSVRQSDLVSESTSTNSVCAKKKPRPTTPTTPTKTTTTTKSAIIHQPSSILRDPSSVSRRPSTISRPPFYVLRMKRA